MSVYMRVMSKVKRAAVAVGAASLLAGAAVAVTAGSAEAAVPHTFKVCADGGYTIQIDLPQENDFGTTAITAGECGQLSLASGITYGNVWGFYNTHPDQRFYVGTATFNSSTGWTGGAEGTTTSPTLVNFH
jgi:guanyl-specific ribonuclease Sa